LGCSVQNQVHTSCRRRRGPLADGSSNVRVSLRSMLTYAVNGRGVKSHSNLELLDETVKSSAVALNRDIRVNGDALAKIMSSLRP
jgi:hypothetical protein